MGWKPPTGAAAVDGSPAVFILYGGPTYHGGVANGEPRYALALLERGYELFDKERDVVALVRELPTPERAASLLRQHGVLTSEALRLEAPNLLLVPEDEDVAVDADE